MTIITKVQEYLMFICKNVYLRVTL